jgi:uncharacterized protein YlzI (FlbEa/FlbD family)
MKQTLKARKGNRSTFLIPIGMSDGKREILNVKYIESIEEDGNEYVFTMNSGKVYRVQKTRALIDSLMPFVVGTSK